VAELADARDLKSRG